MANRTRWAWLSDCLISIRNTCGLAPFAGWGLVSAVAACCLGISCSLPVDIDQIRYQIYNRALEDYGGRSLPVMLCGETGLPEFFKSASSGSGSENHTSNGERRKGLSYPEPRDSWQISSEVAERLLEVIPGIEELLVEDFRERNLGPREINGDLILVKGIGVSKGGCGGEIGKKKSGEFIELSNIGVSESGRQSLVYIGLLFGEAGRGWFILFEQHEGDWIEVDRVKAWVV